jgi:hypothetical protein
MLFVYLSWMKRWDMPHMSHGRDEEGVDGKKEKYE